MLAYLLAIVVGLGSFGLYMVAFFLPEIHRRYDLVWSGVGLFYALVLWVCAGRMTGAVLLGQMASVSLLGWFSWQALTLRLAETPIDQRTELPPNAQTPTEVLQMSFAQMRTNFQQSAHRSPAAAALNRNIDKIESSWISFTSWIKALTTTLDLPANSSARSNSKIDPFTNDLLSRDLVPHDSSLNISPQPFSESTTNKTTATTAAPNLSSPNLSSPNLSAPNLGATHPHSIPTSGSVPSPQRSGNQAQTHQEATSIDRSVPFPTRMPAPNSAAFDQAVPPLTDPVPPTIDIAELCEALEAANTDSIEP